MKTVYAEPKRTVLGEIEYKVEELDAFVKKAASVIVFILLIHTVMLAYIVSSILWKAIDK